MADTLFPCPACATTLRVPDAFRGKVVTCLECRAGLLAPPAGSDGKLTKLTPAAAKGGFPPRTFVALAGLTLLGFAGLVVNGYYAYQFTTDPASLERYADSTLMQMGSIQMFGAPKKDEPTAWDPETTNKRAKEWVAEKGPAMTRMAYLFAGVSLVELLGGLAIAFRKPYWLAWAGCVAAVANLNHGCCFPGLVAGVWAAAVLFGDEGRRLFRIDPPVSAPPPAG
jgi:hypothetical protein